MLARGLARLPARVHVHFHDWELVDRRRAVALELLLRFLRRRRPAISVAELADRASAAPERAWPGVTIAR
jgi:hypothetical protein